MALPDGFDLYLPFPEGVSVRVTCGYGPNCSSFHTNTDSAGSSNDYHALDLVRDEAGGGNGLPVTAMASGRVIYADWATGGWSSFGRLVMIEHDGASDGQTYHSIYAHLSEISVAIDEVVDAKDEVGLLGGSSNMADDVFGHHVHVALYRNAMLLGGPYGGNAVVPEPMEGYEDIVGGDVLLAGGLEGDETGTGGTGATTGNGGSDDGGPDTTTSGPDAEADDGEGEAGELPDTTETGQDTTGAGTSGGNGIPGAPPARGDSGCACRVEHTSGAMWLWVVGILFGVRRRWGGRGRART